MTPVLGGSLIPVGNTRARYGADLPARMRSRMRVYIYAPGERLVPLPSSTLKRNAPKNKINLSLPAGLGVRGDDHAHSRHRHQLLPLLVAEWA
jgi:hypothetical protein